MVKRKKNNDIPLIVEQHPDNYTGYPFITLVQYNKQSYLTIINNTTDTQIGAYVLDYCTMNGVNEELLIKTALQWYKNDNFKRYPFSIEISKNGLNEVMTGIYKTFTMDFVTRVVGPLPSFNMKQTGNVRRRKRKEIPPGVELVECQL